MSVSHAINTAIANASDIGQAAEEALRLWEDRT